MSIVTSGAYKGARVFTKTLFRQHDLLENLKLKSGHAVQELLTDSFSSLKSKEIVTSRFQLFKLRGKAMIRTLAAIPEAALTGIKNLFKRGGKKAEEAVSQ